MATRYNRFTQGSTTFNCRICGKLTRETGYDEESLQLCAGCLLQCYVENSAADYGTDSDEYREAAKNLEDWKKAHPNS